MEGNRHIDCSPGGAAERPSGFVRRRSCPRTAVHTRPSRPCGGRHGTRLLGDDSNGHGPVCRELPRLGPGCAGLRSPGPWLERRRAARRDQPLGSAMRSDQTIPMALDWRPLIASWLMAKCAVRLKRGRPRRSYRPTRRPTRRPSATDRGALVHRVRRPLRQRMDESCRVHGAC